MSKETSSDLLSGFGEYWCGERQGPLVSIVTEPKYRQIFDHFKPNLEQVADAAAAGIRADLESGVNVLPTLYCDFGTISTAKLYGGRILPPPEEGCVHIEPVAQTTADLEALTPCAFEDSDFQLALDLYGLVCDRLDTNDVYLRTPDFQGPLNTLALVMDQQELLMAMYTDPTPIHTALDRITTTLIDYHQRLRRELGGGKVIGSIWPYTFLPEDLGASITQDMLPLLSADSYREFELPCLQRIAQAFNGVQIHCCGKYAQHLPALRASGMAIRSLEFHHPFTPFQEIHAVFGDDIVYIPYLFSECDDYQDYLAFAKDLLAQGTGTTRFWFAQAAEWTDGAALQELVQS